MSLWRLALWSVGLGWLCAFAWANPNMLTLQASKVETPPLLAQGLTATATAANDFVISQAVASPAAAPRSTALPPPEGGERQLVVAAANLTVSLDDINPLTGLPAADPQLLQRRPMAIKISNYPRDIRPQFGLNEADVVFEYYIEWGYTRFIGLFYGNDATQIGPVRSGRYFDEHITRMYHAYYVFNYADPREFNYFLGGDLREFMVVPGYGGCPPFFEHRFSTRIADVSHYETYFDSTKFAGCLAKKSADNSRQDLRRTFFSPAPPSSGQSVSRILTYYSRCDYNYWQYDAKSGRYLRYQEASPSKDIRSINDCVDDPRTYAPLVDSVTGKQVYTDNVVVIYVSHTFANENEQEDEIYHIDLLDSGRAFVFRDGVGMPARWTRSDIDQPLLVTTPSGKALGLKPGRTYFEVIGETSHEWSDGTDWTFEFHTP